MECTLRSGIGCPTAIGSAVRGNLPEFRFGHVLPIDLELIKVRRVGVVDMIRWRG